MRVAVLNSHTNVTKICNCDLSLRDCSRECLCIESLHYKVVSTFELCCVFLRFPWDKDDGFCSNSYDSGSSEDP